MNEGIGNSPQPLSIRDAKEMGLAEPYVATFKSRLAIVDSFDDGKRRVDRLNPNLTVIHPDRVLPAILWMHDDGAEILIGDGREFRSMYMHDEICRQNGVQTEMLKTLPAWLLTVGDKRFISSEFLPHIHDEREDKLRNLLQRYHIEGAFAPSRDFDSKSSWERGIADSKNEWEITWISSSDYTKAMDELLRDDWTSQIAEIYGLTNTEFLRMRLTGELPEDKRKPIRRTEEPPQEATE